MFVCVTEQNEPVILHHPIENNCGLKVALHEIFFQVKWINISAALKNNWVEIFNKTGKTVGGLVIPDGYYGFCSLKEVLSELDISLKLNEGNLKVTVIFRRQDVGYYFAGELARMLGFRTGSGDLHSFDVSIGNSFVGEFPVNLGVHSLLYFHLDNLSTDKNLFNNKPSTVLRVLPSAKAAYCDYEMIRLPNLQFKELVCGRIHSLKIRITDQEGKDVQCDSLHAVLEIK